MMAANGGLHEPFPQHGSAASPPNVHSIRGFTISTQKLPILKAGPIDAMTSKIGIQIPEMIFGDNFIKIEHPKSGWRIEFNAEDALDRVDKTGQAMLQVAHSAEWQRSREHHHEGIKEIVKPFDWSYSTDYKGSVSATPALEPVEKRIPLELLKRPDPIRFFDDVVLYEDELADNGMSIMSCKIRVMPDRLLLLSRFFMRLDGVLFRIRDTRVFVEFATGEIIREYTAKEEQYEKVRQQLAITREDVPALMRDPNRLSELLPVVERVVDGITLT